MNRIEAMGSSVPDNDNGYPYITIDENGVPHGPSFMKDVDDFLKEKFKKKNSIYMTRMPFNDKEYLLLITENYSQASLLITFIGYLHSSNINIYPNIINLFKKED